MEGTVRDVKHVLSAYTARPVCLVVKSQREVTMPVLWVFHVHGRQNSSLSECVTCHAGCRGGHVEGVLDGLGFQGYFLGSRQG